MKCNIPHLIVVVLSKLLENSSFNSLRKKIYFIVYLCICTCVCRHLQVPLEAGRGPQIPQSSSYRQLCAVHPGYLEVNSSLLK